MQATYKRGNKMEATHMVHNKHHDRGLGKLTWKSYMPLIAIVSVILLTTITLAIRDTYILNAFSLEKTMLYLYNVANLTLKYD